MNNDETPRDVVPPAGPSAETLRRLNNAIGKPIQQKEPGELIEDTDGNPIAVEQSKTHAATLGTVTITAAEVEAAGLTPADLPNLEILETRN